MSSQPTPSPTQSTTTSPSRRLPITDEDVIAPPSPPSPVRQELTPGPPPKAAKSSVISSREDCWSEEATRTLIDAWGSLYLQLNRGNLRQKQWQEVADAVNALHASSAKLRRTDVQCKNRIDTTKKKYKIEKSKVVKSKGRYVSSWAHFESLDSLIGGSFSGNNNLSSANGHTRTLRRRVSPSVEPSPSSHPPALQPDTDRRKTTPASIYHLDKDPAISPLLKLPWSVPVGPRSKRTGPGNVSERNFSVMAAAAAAMEAKEDEMEEENDEDGDETWGRHRIAGLRKRKGPDEEEKAICGEGYRKLAEAIGRLAQIYQKVEGAKQQQLVELEKQRMQFAMDLEIQRMKVFMESQVQLEKLKRANRSLANSHYM